MDKYILHWITYFNAPLCILQNEIKSVKHNQHQLPQFAIFNTTLMEIESFFFFTSVLKYITYLAKQLILYK